MEFFVLTLKENERGFSVILKFYIIWMPNQMLSKQHDAAVMYFRTGELGVRLERQILAADKYKGKCNFRV